MFFGTQCTLSVLMNWLIVGFYADFGFTAVYDFTVVYLRLHGRSRLHSRSLYIRGSALGQTDTASALARCDKLFTARVR